MVTVGKMIETLDGLRDTKDVTPWENQFLTDILQKYLLAKNDTRGFSSKQVDLVARIYDKHFAQQGEINE